MDIARFFIPVIAGKKATWTPNNISGLVLELVADSETYQASTLTTPAVADGDLVGGWGDTSTLLNHAKQTTNELRPVLKTGISNGKSMVRVDGTGLKLDIVDADSLDLQAPCFIVMVGSWRGGAAATVAAFAKANAYKFGQLITTGRKQFTAIAKADYNSTFHTWVNEELVILGLSIDSDYDVTFSLNGRDVQKVLGAAQLATSANVLSIGSSAYGNWNGDFGTLLFYNNLPSLTDRRKLLKYLADYYGITLVSEPGLVSCSNSDNYLVTPTYDESGQAMHPRVVYIPAGWNGYKYWMSMSPYPDANATIENPSILVSNDKITWTVPPGLTNPIDARPEGYYNSDPDLILGQDNIMYLYWRDSSANPVPLYVSSSSDGITWSAPGTITFDPAVSVMSPSILYDGSQYRMYECVSFGYHTSATPNGTFASKTTCAFTNGLPAGKILWHISVEKVASEYRALVCVCDSATNGAHPMLYLAISSDGVNFQIGASPLIPLSASGWDSSGIYRASAIWDGSRADIWYSAFKGTSPEVWQTGYTTCALL